MSTNDSVCRVLVSGASGLLGYHARAAMFAANCAALYRDELCPYELVEAPRLSEGEIDSWAAILKSVDLVLHFAGINRAESELLERGNISIATCLVSALLKSGTQPHVIYANSTHCESDTPYGRGKQTAHHEIKKWAEEFGADYTNVILPHIFGEGARANYNNVTATLCEKVFNDEEPTINDGAFVELLHAGEAVDSMLGFYENTATGTIRLKGCTQTVSELYLSLCSFKSSYEKNCYPDLSNSFSAALFNVYRTLMHPESFPIVLPLHSDSRGVLFEAVKGGGGGQIFMSWTEPGVERGNHFHRFKVERFLVISGTAEIRIRRIFDNEVSVYSVSGAEPAYVDMPTLHTHSIVNTGDVPLLTLFWVNEIFDPANPDTYADTVLVDSSDSK